MKTKITRLGLQCQTPLSPLSLGNIPYPLSLNPYPLSLVPEIRKKRIQETSVTDPRNGQ